MAFLEWNVEDYREWFVVKLEVMHDIRRDKQVRIEMISLIGRR